jgi:hypothetical protein
MLQIPDPLPVAGGSAGSSPRSIAARLHHPRSVSGTTPTRGPIRNTAAFNESPGSWAIAAPTSRGARSRNSSGCFLGAGTTHTFPWVHALHQTRAVHSSNRETITTYRDYLSSHQTAACAI